MYHRPGYVRGKQHNQAGKSLGRRTTPIAVRLATCWLGVCFRLAMVDYARTPCSHRLPSLCLTPTSTRPLGLLIARFRIVPSFAFYMQVPAFP